MNLKTLNIVAAIAAVASATLPSQAATPQVTSVTMTQPGPTRLVKIDYTFTGADAVITLDVQTNAPGGAWASIGGKAVCNATGEVWKKVTNDGTTHKIEWHPDLSWPDHVIADGGARAVIIAWTLDNTPDYMAVDISATGGADTQTYYPSADFVPGGVTNDHYKTLTILMRKIMAKDVKWTMGSVAETLRDANEEPHQVTLTNNYYIGVFEVTQTQWQRIAGYNPSSFTVENSMRPVEKICYKDLRQGQGTASSSAPADGGVYPDPPYGNSFLGLLRTKTHIDFDLPSEAQWEFAARAGHGEGYWGDGSPLLFTSANKLDANLALLSRCYFNGGKVANGSSYADPAVTCGATNGTAVVGSYMPNSWGLYDMHGNVSEYCVDTFSENIKSLNGAVNTSGANYVVRGGGWGTATTSCRSAYRSSATPGYRYNLYGFRLACTAGLK